jgi:hypothetical protein
MAHTSKFAHTLAPIYGLIVESPYKSYGVYKGYAASVDAEGAKANENKE